MAPDKKTIMESIEVLLDSGIKPEGEEFSVNGNNSRVDTPFTYMILLKSKKADDYSLFGTNYKEENSCREQARRKRLFHRKNSYVVVKVNKIYGEIIDE